MNFKVYRSITDDRKRRNNKLIGLIIIIIILLTGVGILGILTEDGPEYQARKSMIEENHALKEEISGLKEDNKRLKKELKEKNDYIENLPEQDDAETVSTPAPSQATTPRN